MAKLNRELALALRQPDMKEQLTALGAQAVLASPAQFASHVRGEIARWSKVVADAGIKPEGD